MKKIFFLIILFLNFGVFSDSLKELQFRLKKINTFCGTFKQEVKNFQGDLIYESRGNFWLKKPFFLNWHTIFPEENFLVSDGKSFFFMIYFLKKL